MEAKEIINKLKTILGMEIKLEQQMLADGVTTIEFDSLEVGKEVFIVNEQGNVPLPVGEYELQDGRILVVSQDGIIGELKDAPMQEEQGEPATEVEVEASTEETTAPKKVVRSQVEEQYFQEIEMLKKEIVELKEQLSKKEEVKEVELKEEVKPISFNPEKKEREIHLLADKAPESGISRILKQVYNQ